MTQLKVLTDNRILDAIGVGHSTKIIQAYEAMRAVRVQLAADQIVVDVLDKQIADLKAENSTLKDKCENCADGFISTHEMATSVLMDRIASLKAQIEQARADAT